MAEIRRWLGSNGNGSDSLATDIRPGSAPKFSAERRSFGRKVHANIEAFTRTGQLALLLVSRYVRLILFSFLILIGRFANLDP